MKRPMTFEEFSNAYRAAFRASMRYSPDEIGSALFTEKMANLADDYPDFLERLEAEEDAKALDNA